MLGVHMSKSSLLLYFLRMCEMVVGMTKLEFRYFETGVPWNTAYRLCREKGGQLMKIRSEEIYNVLKNFRPSGDWSDDFWVGVNKNSNNEIIFDDCEPASSWTMWDSDPANDKPCIMLKKDELKWINEVCDKKVNVMCEIPKGPCTYESRNVSCPSSNTQDISLSSSSECKSQCEQTKDSNNFNCWAYKWDGTMCTLYYSENPYFCKSGSSATVDTYIRVCFSYDLETLSFPTMSGEKNSKPLSRTCSSWDPPTTTTSTTEVITTTTAQTTTESLTTTEESTTSESTTNVQTTSETQTTTGVQTTAEETTVETTSEIHHTTDSNTAPTQQTSAETTLTTPVAQTSTNPQTTEETHSTANTQTEEHQTSTEPSTITVSAFERFGSNVCVCDFCGDRNQTTVENEIKEIVSQLTVDVQVLSATRRKKESQPDSRPSARNIGYLGIVLFLTVFGTIFILDIKKLLQDMGFIKK